MYNVFCVTVCNDLMSLHATDFCVRRRIWSWFDPSWNIVKVLINKMPWYGFYIYNSTVYFILKYSSKLKFIKATIHLQNYKCYPI